MDILHISPINMSSTNGLRFAVPGLVNAQHDIEGIKVKLLNVADKKLLNIDEVDEFKFDFYNYEDIDSINKFIQQVGNPNIVIFHGIYNYKYIKLYKYFLKHNIPYIIVPHCSLTLGAQKQKNVKKIIGNLILFKRFIEKASKIHYLTQNEKKQSNKFKNEGFVVGNGMNLPKIKSKKINSKNYNLNISYIGRLDINHKGLDILLKALSNIKIELEDRCVNVSLYGTDFEDGKSKLYEMIDQMNLQKIVNIKDPIFGKEKERVLEETDIFITTSRFEGHPMSVIEAMSHCIPCILTDGTNMTEELYEYNAGWRVSYNDMEIAKEILNAISSYEKIIDKGNNARLLIEERYTWDKIANKTINEYKSIIAY